MNRLVLIPLLSVMVSAASVASAQSPWLPPKGEFSLNPSYTFETFDEYFFGESKDDVSFGDVDHHTLLFGFEYGITDEVALDLTTGYTRALSSRNETNDGWADTTFGVRYRLMDEMTTDFPFYAPTITVRAGGILEGSYFTDQLEAPGKGASGFEGSLHLGKLLGESGVRIYGDIGYRLFGNSVPDDFYGGFGVAATVLESIDVSLGYRHVHSVAGPDVDDRGFAPHEFPERREISHTVDLGLGYQTLEGRYFGVRVGKTVAGRNTGAKWILGFSAFLPF